MKEFPRRRDVREIAKEIFRILCEHLDPEPHEDVNDDDFDHAFLTDVRNLMREGLAFADAVLIAGTTEEEPSF